MQATEPWHRFNPSTYTELLLSFTGSGRTLRERKMCSVVVVVSKVFVHQPPQMAFNQHNHMVKQTDGSCRPCAHPYSLPLIGNLDTRAGQHPRLSPPQAVVLHRDSVSTVVCAVLPVPAGGAKDSMASGARCRRIGISFIEPRHPAKCVLQRAKPVAGNTPAGY
jgi:hypothetical protein